MKKFSTIVALCCCLSFAASAQSMKVDPRYGKVSEQEVQMSVYDKDTSAVAVYLYDRNCYRVAFESNAILKTHQVRQRIKILKEAGKGYADYSIYLSKNSKERVTKLKVTTYNLKDGKLVPTKMSSKYVFNNSVSSDLFETKFTAQDVMVGSVIDVELEVESMSYRFIQDIKFKKSIPVVNGEFEFRHPGGLVYSKIQKGAHPIVFNQSEETKNSSTMSYQEIIENYSFTDMPASKNEPYNWCPSFYKDGISFSLVRINIPGSIFQEVNKDWSEIDKAISEMDYASTIFHGRTPFKSEVDQIAKDEEKSDMEKIVAIRNLVYSKVKWNERESFGVNVSDAVKNGTGTDADINAIVGASLVRAGFNAQPVLIRTRDEGPLVEAVVSSTAFTKLLLMVTIGDRMYFLDASDENGYLNVLPEECLVSSARIVDKNGHGDWAYIAKLAKNLEVISVQGTIGADGLFEYSATMDMTNQEACSFKGVFRDLKDEDKTIEFLDKLTESEVESYSLSGLDEWSPKANITLKGSRECETGGDMIYINPFIRTFHIIDAFENEERTLPVDMDFPETIMYNVMFTIPEGYEIVELPQNFNASFPALRSSIRTVYTMVEKNAVRFSLQYVLGETFCEVQNYPFLREYWHNLGNIYKDRIVIRKVQ